MSCNSSKNTVPMYLLTDAYKVTHPLQYPPAQKVHSTALIGYLSCYKREWRTENSGIAMRVTQLIIESCFMGFDTSSTTTLIGDGPEMIWKRPSAFCPLTIWAILHFHTRKSYLKK